MACDAKPCKNNGTCSEVDGNDNYTCSCENGYTDENCTTGKHIVKQTVINVQEY